MTKRKTGGGERIVFFGVRREMIDIGGRGRKDILFWVGIDLGVKFW